MKKRNQKRNGGGRVLLILLILVMAAVVAWVMVSAGLTDPDGSDTGIQTTEPIMDPVTAAPTAPAQTEEPKLDGYPLDLGQGIVLLDTRSYSGMYMEDGSNEIVSDVCMILVENQSGGDLQYAEVSLGFPNGDCRFQITNLPAGEKIVLLEQNRVSLPFGELQDAELSNAAWFPGGMDPHTELFQISGGKGVLNIRNLSGEPISNDIYVYYKYAAEDVFYGGITFRVKIEGGLEAEELRQVISGHYDPELCCIVDIDWYES